MSICTGTLVEPNKILTANHCTRADNARMKVQCGYQGFDPKNLKVETTLSGNSVYTSGIVFKESAEAKISASILDLDQSTLTLDHKLSIKPMKVANANFKSHGGCSVSGYGLSKELFAGFLFTGKIVGLPKFTAENKISTRAFLQSSYNPEKNYFESNDEIKYLVRDNDIEQMTSSVALPGDSGGPIICDGSNGEPILFGVISVIKGSIVSKGTDLTSI